MAEMKPIKCPNCGTPLFTTTWSNPGSTYGEAAEPQLDQVIAPSFLEKSLPFLALIAVIVGFCALPIYGAVNYSIILFNPVLVGIYLNRKGTRRQRAKEMVQRDVVRESVTPLYLPNRFLNSAVSAGSST
jgi:hypothetical protein